MAVIREKIEEKKGAFKVQMEHEVVTDTDETEIARQLERLQRGKTAVDGDGHREEMKAKAEDDLWETGSCLRNTKQSFLAIKPRLKCFPALQTSKISSFYFQVFKYSNRPKHEMPS